MKTKSIFRKVLLTIMMVMGTTWVLADEIPLYEGSGSGNIDVLASEFANAQEGDFIYVYCPNQQLFVGTLNGEALYYSPYNDWIRNGEYYSDLNSRFELEITYDILSKLKEGGLHLQEYTNTITKVTLLTSGAEAVTKYTLTYEVDGTVLKTERLEEGATPTPPADPVKQNYIFIEWENLPETMPAENITVTAKFGTYHSIVYYSNGNYFDGKYNIPYGATLYPDYVPATNPTKVGFIFDHWDGLPETMPDEDLTVEAVFVADPNYHNYKKINYYVDYSLVKSVDWEVGTTIVPEDTVKAGHIFSGWTGFPDNMVMPDQDINVYGSFTAIYNLTLNFDATKGTVTADKLSGITQGEQILVTVTPAEGYEVASVTFTDVNGATPNNWGNYTVQFGTSDITCEVAFVQEAAKVYNVWNGSVIGGNVTASPNVAEAGTTVTLTLAPYANYVLESLTVKDQENNSIEVADNQFTMPDGNVWVYAKFVDPADLVAKHTLSFIVDGRTTNVEVAEGTALSTLLPTPSKEGYNFTGWSGMPANGNMPTSDLELTAVFVAKVYTSVSVGSTGYSTYCSDKALYFQGNEGVKAFIAKSKSDTEVTLVQVSGAVAAGTGLLLVGNPNTTADVEEVAAGESYSNLLVGVLNSSETVNAANKYVLVDKDGTVKFADTANNPATVAPGKAYLQVAAAARQLRIRFEDGTTAILAVKAAGEDADVYDLRGQRVNTLGKGLYIINGKKVFVK